MNRTRWIIFAAVCVLVLGGLIVYSRKDKVNVDSVDASQIITGAQADHVFGNPSSKVVLIEYGDFQCPNCGQAYPQLKAVSEQYKGQIAFVFRNFPLTTIHPNALAGSTAAEAAAMQNKFWEMHDKLYENQSTWTVASATDRTNIFNGYAEELGLNVDKFKTDYASKEVSSRIDRDRALGGKLGVNATPTVYIGNTKMASDVISDLQQGQGDTLRDQLDSVLKSNGVTPPARSTAN